MTIPFKVPNTATRFAGRNRVRVKRTGRALFMVKFFLLDTDVSEETKKTPRLNCKNQSIVPFRSEPEIQYEYRSVAYKWVCLKNINIFFSIFWGLLFRAYAAHETLSLPRSRSRIVIYLLIFFFVLFPSKSTITRPFNKKHYNAVETR